jgi:hypothetical protein
MEPVYKGAADYQLVSRTIVGDPTIAIEYRRDEFGRGYRYLPPSTLREVYQRTNHTRCVTINRRRGFSQYALVNEFSDHAIGVFMHRGDSPGEAGSNVYFLANKNSRHEPCGRLFDKLSRKLDDRVLIITDGSNTGLKRLKAFHRQDIAGPAAYSVAAKLGFVYGGFSWQCVGYMSNRYGPTLIWGLSRHQ